MKTIIGHEVKSFDYDSIKSDVVHKLVVVGAKIKDGDEGEYLLITSRSIADQSMPSVRSNLATEWRLDQFLASIGLKKLTSLKELYGKEFEATLVVHPFNGNKFIDVYQYV